MRIVVIGAVAATVLGSAWAAQRFIHTRQMRDCENNLKMMGLSLKMYAVDHNCTYPPLDGYGKNTRLAPLTAIAGEYNSVYPDHKFDLASLISPSHPNRTALHRQLETDQTEWQPDNSYWYLGYRVYSDEDGEAFVELLRADARKEYQPPGGYPFSVLIDDNHVLASIWEYCNRFYVGTPPEDERDIAVEKLQGARGIELNVDPWNSRWADNVNAVMIERPSIHGNGSHILYVDGHVEFVEYPGLFPMTERFIKALESLDADAPG